MLITPNVHSLRIEFKVTIEPGRAVDRFVNIFVLLGTRTWIIDTGVAGSETALFDALRESNRALDSVAGIVLTHGHADHIGAAKALGAATGAPVYAHPAERSWIEDTDTQAKERPIPGFHQLVGGSVRIDRELNDGDSIELGAGLRLRVIHSPGHSPGSTSFLLQEQGLLFAGDAVPVPGDMPVYDDALASIETLLRLRSLAGVDTLLSAWDEPRSGSEVQAALNRGIAVIDRIHAAVRNVARNLTSPDPLTLCRQTLEALSLPAAMANPLVARTFMGHYALRDRERLH